MTGIDPQEAIDLVHSVGNCEIAYETALNLGRGVKGHNQRLENAREAAFVAMVGRTPNDLERERLLGDS